MAKRYCPTDGVELDIGPTLGTKTYLRCPSCDYAEQGDVGVGVAVEAVTRLAVEAGCYVARNRPPSTSNGCTMEGQNESHPGAALTAPGLANPYRTGVDMDQSTGPVKTGTEQ